MKLKLTKIIILILISLITTFSMAPVNAANETICDNANVPEEVKAASGCDGKEVDTLDNVVQNILNAIILVSGTVAVVFVLIGGIQYMTSTGDPGKVDKAKKTILYACIGLAICVLAFAIVNFVIENIIGNQ